MIPGEIIHPDGEVVALPDRTMLELEVTNSGDRPIQVGSHYHFAEANPALRFDRAAARGFRLAVPAGTSVRFEPGMARSVTLVELGGARIVAGLRGETAGPVDQSDASDEGASDA